MKEESLWRENIKSKISEEEFSEGVPGILKALAGRLKKNEDEVLADLCNKETQSVREGLKNFSDEEKTLLSESQKRRYDLVVDDVMKTRFSELKKGAEVLRGMSDQLSGDIEILKSSEITQSESDNFITMQLKAIISLAQLTYFDSDPNDLLFEKICLSFIESAIAEHSKHVNAEVLDALNAVLLTSEIGFLSEMVVKARKAMVEKKAATTSEEASATSEVTTTTAISTTPQKEESIQGFKLIDHYFNEPRETSSEAATTSSEEAATTTTSTTSTTSGKDNSSGLTEQALAEHNLNKVSTAEYDPIEKWQADATKNPLEPEQEGKLQPRAPEGKDSPPPILGEKPPLLATFESKALNDIITKVSEYIKSKGEVSVSPERNVKTQGCNNALKALKEALHINKETYTDTGKDEVKRCVIALYQALSHQVGAKRSLRLFVQGNKGEGKALAVQLKQLAIKSFDLKDDDFSPKQDDNSFKPK